MAETTLIPLFPLPLAVLPGEELPLHIFEPRYREMIADCREGDADGRPLPFGISFAENGEMDTLGCTVRLESIAREYDDGRLDIATRGERRYRLVELDRSRSYYQAQVVFVQDEPDVLFDLSLREEVRGLHRQILEQAGGETELWIPDDEPASFLLAATARVGHKEKRELLMLTDENQRMRALLRLFVQVLARWDAKASPSKEIQVRIKANGFFRNIRGIDLG